MEKMGTRTLGEKKTIVLATPNTAQKSVERIQGYSGEER